MKLKVLNPFEDFKEGVIRQKGEVFTVKKERAVELELALPMGFYEEVNSKDDEEVG